ncbi:nuclear transport factor 2 family protein [Agromyces sp. H3Y2-19a]|jgi:ketosteroid isomerase-like protein|uniref:YybH family protein n=1 Tax=Agromyces TaxID=33877 RepID=UPI001E5E0A53|nr:MULTISPECIES: nuclear transport factor 2 family protein [Agromyces]MCD5345376.1 nuclear transport factor 2 family protein [Agromyces sp. S2-1-8]MDF0513465.1 nuclear transport factor 2 family protein [Agromyces chromiiresistens]
MSIPVTDLGALPLAFAERFNAQDLEGLLDLNEPGAVFVPAPGQPVEGDAVRPALEQFLALRLPISMRTKHAFVTGGTGLVMAEWAIAGAGPDGSEVSLWGITADVARYDEQHGWRYVIDNPFGTV